LIESPTRGIAYSYWRDTETAKNGVWTRKTIRSGEGATEREKPLMAATLKGIRTEKGGLRGQRRNDKASPKISIAVPRYWSAYKK